MGAAQAVPAKGRTERSAPAQVGHADVAGALAPLPYAAAGIDGFLRAPSRVPSKKGVTLMLRSLTWALALAGAAIAAAPVAARAIIRCGATGYDLPAEKFDQWDEIEMIFNPTNMRIK